MAVLTSEEKTRGLVAGLAERENIDPRAYWEAVKQMCGCGLNAKGEEVATDADFLAMLHLASKYRLDPLRKEVCLIKTKAGPRPYIGVDGWLNVMTGHPDYLAHEIVITWSGDKPGKGTPDAATLVLYTKRRAELKLPPFQHTEYLRECMVTGEFTPWRTHPARMLSHKALIQGVRFCWGLYVPDLDEVEQVDRHVAPTTEIVRSPITPAVPIQGAVTPTAAPAPDVIDVGAAKAQRETLPSNFDQDASRKIDAEIAAAEGKGEFDDLDLG